MGIVNEAPFRRNVIFIRFVLRGLMAIGLVDISALSTLAAGGFDTGNTAWILSATALVVSVIILIIPKAVAGPRVDD